MSQNDSAAVQPRILLSPGAVRDELFLLLCAFDDVCRRNKLTFSLAAGTLLGAARHCGFIPWDDDVDVYMPRPHYERMLKLTFPMKVNGLTVDFSDGRTSGSGLAYGKFTNLGIAVQEEDKVESGHLWIDVYPIDGVPDAGLDRTALEYARACNAEAWEIVTASNDEKPKNGFTRKRQLDKACSLIVEAEGVYRSRRFGRGEYLGEFGWWNFFGGGNIVMLPVDAFHDMVKLEFEGRLFPVMSCWNDYLTTLYGNYMALPPEEDRRTHRMRAWRI